MPSAENGIRVEVGICSVTDRRLSKLAKLYMCTQTEVMCLNGIVPRDFGPR